MQIMNLIFTIVTIIANCFLTLFAITAWFALRRLNRDFAGMKRVMAIVTTITMGNQVKDSFDQLSKMKATFHRLVENEQYEEAEELKNAITNMERNAKAAMEHFKDICGDSCEVIVTKVKKHIDEEDL